jgi:hypothetical protein
LVEHEYLAQDQGIDVDQVLNYKGHRRNPVFAPPPIPPRTPRAPTSHTPQEEREDSLDGQPLSHDNDSTSTTSSTEQYRFPNLAHPGHLQGYRNPPQDCQPRQNYALPPTADDTATRNQSRQNPQDSTQPLTRETGAPAPLPPTPERRPDHDTQPYSNPAPRRHPPALPRPKRQHHGQGQIRQSDICQLAPLPNSP